MKLLVFSDLHGEEAALESLQRIAPDFDHVLICGDISRSVSFAEDVLKAFPTAFIIPGNWDSEQVNTVLASSRQWLHGKRVKLGKSLSIAGFGYSPPTPFGTFGELSEQDILSGMAKLKMDSNTLLMLHCPPKGHFDQGMLGRHIGSESILKMIKENKPLAAFFGHAHEHEGTAKLGQTTLVKLPPANSMRACSVVLAEHKISQNFVRHGKSSDLPCNKKLSVEFISL
ncbi:metallophosphoesterase family protein [Candidatus Micrarchaeota archaeon]|nr:metallophosphoesterase family protein [Candidatus Micrarchaeota archaeon]